MAHHYNFGDHHISADIKLPSIVKKWLVDILLENMCFVFLLPWNYIYDLLDLVCDHNPKPSIGILTWLYDPCIISIIVRIILILLWKLVPLRIPHFHNVIGFREVIENIFIVLFIVAWHIVQECLFVTKVLIMWKMVMTVHSTLSTFLTREKFFIFQLRPDKMRESFMRVFLVLNNPPPSFFEDPLDQLRIITFFNEHF